MALVTCGMTWIVAPSLELYATYAYNHARLKSGLYRGNHFRLSPDHAFSLAATWRADLLGGVVEVRPSYSWQSKMFFADSSGLPWSASPWIVPFWVVIVSLPGFFFSDTCDGSCRIG